MVKVDLVETEPLIVYINDQKHPLSPDYVQHMAKVADYTKIPFASVDIRFFNEEKQLDFTPRVIFINSTEGLQREAKQYLIDFVADGGTLVFPSLNEDREMGFLTGVKADAPYEYDLEAKGIHFLTNVLPGLDSISFYPAKSHYALKGSNFSPAVNVIATAISDPEMPIILENKIGNGQVIHFNTGIEFGKTDRGLLFAAALRGLEGVPYPIVNVSTIFIDDFPGPTYDIESEPIASELGISQVEYVTDVWWPDMLKVAKQFDIDYSAYTIFNYHQIKNPPFLFNEWDLNKTMKNGKQVSTSVWLSQEVLKNDFELALHGYNHESLLKEIWTNPENIEAAFKALRKKWIVNQLGEFPTSYVAPSNYIDSIGLVHMKMGMPEMKFMSTTYEGDLAEGGDREYDIDPYVPSLFDFPRITSGYVFKDQKQYIHQSTYLYTGIWSHFIHPDDVFQLPIESNTSAGEFGFRNGDGLGWYTSSGNRKGMFTEWVDYLEKIKRIHPSTRYLDVSTGATITRDWRNSKYNFTNAGDVYSVEKASVNQWSNENYYWFVYAKMEHAKSMETELKRVAQSYTKTPMQGGVLFNVKTTKPSLIFSADTRLKAELKQPKSLLRADVLEAFGKYEKDRAFVEKYGSLDYKEEDYLEEPEVVEDSVAYFVANDQLTNALNMLQENLENSAGFEGGLFDDFALYAGYNGDYNRVWNFIESTYQTKSKALGLQYLNAYLEVEQFPNEELNERWLFRKIEQDPTNKEAVDAYFTSFYSSEYKPRLKSLLQILNEKRPSEEHYALYIQYLIDFEPELLTTELKGKSPENLELLWPKAASITYAFSDEGQIQEALLWSDYTKEIPMTTILQWWVELEAFNKMESVYEEYIVDHPNDYGVKAFISSVWYDMGEYERSALVANQLPEGNKDKIEIEKRFNPDVIYFEPDVQKFLIDRTPELFTAQTLYKIKKELRYTENNSIELNTNYVEDNFDQSVWTSDATFNLKTEKGRQHSFSIRYSEVSDLVLNEFDPLNVGHQLYGLRYSYQTAMRPAKPLFSVGGGLQQDNFNQMFYDFQAAISLSKENVFKSLSLDFAPVQTGVGISKEVYRSELTGYYERGSTKFWQTSFGLVGSYYTNGGFEGALTSRLFANFNRENKSRFSPFAELFVSAANVNQESGSPYWVIDNRIYGGGGLAWTYGQDERKFRGRLEGGYFFDSYTDGFMRITGDVSFPIKDFTYFTARFEIFNESLYYSNGVQFGIKHFLDRKRKYDYKPRSY